MSSSVAPKGSHRRQVSAASDRRPASPAKISSQSSTSGSTDTRIPRLVPGGQDQLPCSLWVHDEGFSREEVLFNPDAFGDIGVNAGDLIEIVAPQGDSLESSGTTVRGGPELESLRTPAASPAVDDGSGKTRPGRFLFLVKPWSQDLKSRHPNLQVSIAGSIANIFGFKNRSQVLLSLADRARCEASRVELVFRDQFLLRSDMWRLTMSELAGRPVYKGQKILFMGTIKATVKSICVGGKKVFSGYFAPSTVPIFRSESARFVLFIQMSKEMWDFDSEGTGDILFSRVINGFLPELFKRWASADAHHLVTIVLFTRVQYDVEPSDSAPTALNNAAFNSTPEASSSESQDFYRVVVNDMPSGRWTAILDELKKEFRIFLRDVSIPPPRFPQSPTSAEEGPQFSDDSPAAIAGRPSSALQGNILEAINVASSYLTYEHIGRDLLRTGTSIVVITPGAGVFEVPFDALALTSDTLTSRTIGIDLICLSPTPLHSVPLFKYRTPPDQSSRPGSSVSKDTMILASSPEVHGSAATISTGRSHGASFDSSVDPASRFPSKVQLAQADEWSYGIPNWVDISFWDPRNYRATRTALEKVSKSPLPETLTRQSKQFTSKVRMYEIQMMGVMESEQSNISIPYLPQVRTTLQNTSAAMLHNRGFPVVAHLSPPKSRHKPQLSASNRPGSFMMSLKESKKNMLSAPAKQRTESLEWMDTYDTSAFSAFPRSRRARRGSKSKHVGDTEATEPHVQERRPARSNTGLREPRSSPSSSHGRPHEERTEGKNPSAKGTPTPAPPPRKSIIKSASRLSAPRISRSISFALRGLGPAPRAVPSTEINVEHAKGVPVTSAKTNDEATAQSFPIDSQSALVSPSTATPKLELPSVSTTTDDAEIIPSRPISIRAKTADEANLGSHAIDNSFSTTATEIPCDPGTNYNRRSSLAIKGGSTRLDLGPHASGPEPVTKKSPENMLAPWIKPVTPWKPPKHGPTRSSWFGRWQHVYPRMPNTSSVKWKSLKSPAALPLTTEEFPTENELASEYLQTPYMVYPNDDSETSEAPKSREVLLREMILHRLSRGFQFVIGKRMQEYSLGNIDIFDTDSLSKDGTTIFMSIGNIIHKMVCVTGGEIEVTKFTRKTFGCHLSDARDRATSYSPAVKTVLSSQYCKNTVNLALAPEEYNWSNADAFLAGHKDDLTNTPRQLGFWRTRFVLIPVQVPPNARRPMLSYNEDNEEEIHLLGIYQLTQMWQKHRYIPPEERHFQSSGHQKREQNPLNILYQTCDPSLVVAAELDRLLLDDPGLDNPPAQLLPDSELFHKSSISLSALAQAIQGDKGVRMMDRRWHWRLHYNCFIGIEFTTWILRNFRDIDTREEAIEFGNEMMKHGLFHHVQRRHNFRDGNYFYQIADEYRISRPESRGGWFQHRKVDKSVPQTPMGEGASDSPASIRAKSEKSIDEASSKSAGQTPSKPGRKVAVSLAKSMKYDMDPRKRSNRPEVIDLNYDRLHNPDNCFHIELSWMSATPKLVEDTILSWMTTAEKYGLKLVELPISEASSIVETQILRRPYPVKLKTKLPEPPVTTALPSTSFSSHGTPDWLYYHKAILKKFDFVLDFESCNAFPADVEVLYPWGKADYRYPQYVHRTGAVLAQITDEGHFLLLANRLYFSRAQASAKDGVKFERNEYNRPRAHTLDYHHSSPRLSPSVRASADPSQHTQPSQNQNSEPLNAYRLTNQLKDEMQAFFNDTEKLDRFFAEVKAHAKPAVSTKTSPTVPSTTDSSIPTLELPASVVPRQSQSPFAQPKSDASSTKTNSIDALMYGASGASPRNDPADSPRPKRSS